MKCKGIIKEKNKLGKEVVRSCNSELDRFAIFCSVCGEPTAALTTDLSAKKNIQEAWKEFFPVKQSYFRFSIFIILTGFLLTGLTIYFTSGKYWLSNALLLFVIPFILIPLAQPEQFINNPLTIQNYVKALTNYPKLWLFTLINILFFLFLKILCTGFLLGIAIDPLLHFVRFIMVFYWLEIIYAAPFLFVRGENNMYKAFKRSHDGSRELHWQILGLYLMLLGINILGAALLGFGLLITIPFTYVVLEKYYIKMKLYQLC
jgi:hypothetical protein